jgi:phage tail sheath protein FI
MNPNNPMTPGVYTVEQNAFPNSVAEVPTAIPAFIGYTQKAEKNGKPITEPVLVGSLQEFERYFGGAPISKFPIVQVTGSDYDVKILGKAYKVAPAGPGLLFYLYNCLRLFYLNGGGPCYIVSVGLYLEELDDEEVATEPSKDDFLAGLAQLVNIPFPKPTMILMPDALLLTESDYYTVQQQTLMQCGQLKDRVALLDVYRGDWSETDASVISKFRSQIGNSYLSYGISYYPFLRTTVVGPTDVSYANVDQDSSYATTKLGDLGTLKKLTDIFPSERMLDRLQSITADLEAANQLLITPHLVLGAAALPTLPTDPTRSTAPFYPSWSLAYAAFPSSATSAQMLVWKATVIYSMALVLSSLGKNGKIADPPVALTTPDLLKAVQGMMAPGGYLASLLVGLVAYDVNFPGTKWGVFSNSSALTSLGLPAASPAPVPGTPASPYGKKATADDAFNQASVALDQTFKVFNNAMAQVGDVADTLLGQYNASLENKNDDYKNLMMAIAAEASILPPCAAMAGMFTLVDNSVGVWQSPANRNINSVIAPMVAINDDDQATLNVDALAGKSINAIRSFYGRGPAIVWGARTLDGNSQDWKYINVRRTMIMIEQSVANAAFSLVFEANDSGTWTTCSAMISNFLHNLWVAGALQGASSADAYSVAVGLGATMTGEDILEGIMRVQVKVAMVHPAEFIIITYEQQMAKS